MAGRKKNGGRRSTADLTLEVLGKIHTEMTGMRGDVRGVRDGLDQTNQRLDQTNQRLERVEQGLLDLGTFMKQLALLRVEDRLPR